MGVRACGAPLLPIRVPCDGAFTSRRGAGEGVLRPRAALFSWQAVQRQSRSLCHCPNSGRAIPKPDTSAGGFARSSP